MNNSCLRSVANAARQHGWPMNVTYTVLYGRRYVLFGPRRLLVRLGSGRRVASLLLDPVTCEVLRARRGWPLVPVWALAAWVLSGLARPMVWGLRLALAACSRLERWARRVAPPG